MINKDIFKCKAQDIDNPNVWRIGFYCMHEKKQLCVWNSYRKDYEKEVKDNQEHYIIYDGFADWNLPKPFYRAEVIGDTLCRFTGFIGYKNHEIYENDIVILSDINLNDYETTFEYQVINKDGCWQLNSLDKDKQLILSEIYKRVIVMRNIFDNKGGADNKR